MLAEFLDVYVNAWYEAVLSTLQSIHATDCVTVCPIIYVFFLLRKIETLQTYAKIFNYYLQGTISPYFYNTKTN